MPEPSSNAAPSKQKFWGMGLAFLGFVVELFSAASPFPLVVFLVGIWMCVVGIAGYARAKGISIAYGLFGLLPILGVPLFWFQVPLLITSPRRFWIGIFVCLGLFGILAAIAIPNFMTYGAKARQSEAKVNLGGIFTTATSYKAENKTFAISDINQLGYAPAGNPIYTLWYAVNGVPTRINVVSPDRARGCDGPPTIAKVAASATGFTAAARGNMDGDETCDEWSINDARVLTNTINDVNN